jgi:hypothetical protein
MAQSYVPRAAVLCVRRWNSQRRPSPPRRTLSRLAVLLTALLAVLGGGSVGRAQLPATQLFAVSPPGGRQGTTLDLTITAGADLEGVNQLLFSHPGITAQQKTSPPTPFRQTPEPIPNQFTVTIAPDVPPGVYDVRAVGTFGVSNPRAFMVGDREELLKQAGINTREKAMPLPLETWCSGQSDGAAADWYRLALKQGQRLVVDVWAQRLDSRMDATLLLRDAQGRELARSRDVNGKDPLVDFAVPADGDYFLQVFDAVYAGGPEYYYRLLATAGPYIDFILPPMVPAATRSEVTVYGRNLPGSVPAEGIAVQGQQLEKLSVPVEPPAETAPIAAALPGLAHPEAAVLDGFEFRLPGPAGLSNPFYLGYALAPTLVEQEPNDAPAQAQQLSLPCDLAGSFQHRGDQDWLEFSAQQGEVWWIEVFSQRMGLQTDPSVLLTRVGVDNQGQEQMADITELDDEPKNVGGLQFNSASADPVYRFAVPETGRYRLLVRNLYATGSEGDPRSLYRVCIRPENPDFRLVALQPYPGNARTQVQPWGSLLRKGGTLMFDVFALRRDGFAGPIELRVEGLPEGLSAAPVTLPAGLDAATVVITAAEQAAAWVGNIQIVGKAKIGEAERTHVAWPASVLYAAQQNLPGKARLARSLPLAVSATESDPFLVEIAAEQPLEMSLAGQLSIPVKVLRRGEIKAPITLTALNLPPNIGAQQLALDQNTNEGALVLQVNANASPGEATLYLQAQTTVGYRRNLAEAEAAAAAKAELEKIAAELAAKAQEADQAKQRADQAVSEAEVALKQAQEALTAAEAEAAKAAEAAKTSLDPAAAAKAAADADPNNADLAKAAQEAQQAADSAAERAKAAQDAVADARKKVEQAQAALDKAREEQAKAAQAAQDAAALAKAAADAKTAAEQKAANLANAAAPRDVNVFLPSVPVTIRILPSPVAATLTAPPAVKQGATVEIPVAVMRRFGFGDAVNLELVNPNNVAGLQAQAVSIPGDANEGRLVIQLAADAPPGTHALAVKVTVNFNGAALATQHSFTLTIEAAQ